VLTLVRKPQRFTTCAGVGRLASHILRSVHTTGRTPAAFRAARFSQRRPAGPPPGAMIGPVDDMEALRPDRAPATKLTYDDLLLFPDDGRRHELIDGEHYVTPSPNTRHQRLVGRFYEVLALYLRERSIGEALLAPLDVVLSDFDVVEPDLLVIAADQAHIVTDTHVRGAPALVIEILSPGTRKTDEQTKRRLYDRTGVGEYWVVDPELDLIKVYRRASDGSFPRAAELTREQADVLTTPLLPGLTLPLAALFR
jgi:Uma2 family endonuclease